MKCEIDLLGLHIKAESDIVDKNVISPTCIELKIKTKMRINGWLKWLTELLQH